MNFVEVKKTQKDAIRFIYQSYSETFSENERRDEEGFIHLFEQKNVSVFFIVKENEKVGYLVVWKLGFLFIEHFEIFEQFRNCGLGGEVLKLLSKKYGCIVLESEPDVIGKEAKSRIEFYKKNGFCIIDKNYIQPPYDGSKPSVNLFLMSNCFIINLLEIENTIKKNVYL